MPISDFFSDEKYEGMHSTALLCTDHRDRAQVPTIIQALSITVHNEYRPISPKAIRGLRKEDCDNLELAFLSAPPCAETPILCAI